MTETNREPIALSPRRRWRRWLAGLLLASTVGIGCWLWFRPARPSAPIPPEVVWEKDEPAVSATLNAIRAKVLHNPSSGETWGLLGEVLLAHSYDDEAARCFAEAERLDPVNPRWPYFLGGLLRFSDAKAAVVHLRQAVERLGPGEAENFAPRLLLAEVLLAEDNLDEAEGHFRHVLAAQPENVRARYGLGLATCRRGDLAASRQFLLPCVENPYTARKASAQLAAICQRLGDDDAADTFSQKARALAEDYSWLDPFADEFRALAVGKRSRFQSAEVLDKQGRFREAVRVLSQIAWDTEDRRAIIALGVGLSKTSDQAGAEKALRMGLAQASPSDPDSYMVSGCYFLSMVLYQKAERLRQANDAKAKEVFEEASSWAGKALVHKPDHAFAHIYLGLSRMRLGRRGEALASLRQAVACAPGLTEAHLYLGEALAEEGSFVEADSELRQAARLARADDPRPAAARARLQGAEKKRGSSESRP